MLGVSWFQAAFSQHVFFGERALDSNRIALYFDQQGTVYPDYLIADSSLSRCSGSLADWYQCHPSEFGEICKKYQCNQDSKALQEAVVAQLVRKINAGNYKTVTFLIHGYRKSFRDIDRGISSVQEFKILTDRLDSLQLKSDLYVEVYWDATYDCCFSTNKQNNDSLFHLFELAQLNAPKIGLSLRKVMSSIHAEKINVIGHSLGSKVAVSSLFDLVPSGVKTPSNACVNLCLIAPAIGGREVFSHFYERATSVDFSQKDNYRVCILYNENDFVLKKKDNKFGLFGPGTLKYGETTLGCNHRNEAVKLSEYFMEHFPQSYIQLVNMSRLGKNHSLKAYASSDNLQELVNFCNGL